MKNAWTPIEPDLAAALRASPRPLDALANGDFPAVIFRQAYPPHLCAELIERLIAAGFLYNPAGPPPDHLLREAIPEGFYREGLSSAERRAWADDSKAAKHRLDIGTSLGYRGSNPEAFFAHAAQTREVFEQLFANVPSPVDVIYERLTDLSGGRQKAVTAYEPDGRTYGPAIFRAHYGSYTYKPHFDSVRLREKRETFSVYRFAHQFAGVLVLQNAEADGATAQSKIHRYLWEPGVQEHLEAGTFHEFAAEHDVESCRVMLDPGDLYFFNTRAIHEVPGLAGEEPRVVLATFIGYSSDEDEIFVWS